MVCCTSGFIYHYGQISEGRTADDDANAARLLSRWRDVVRIDEDEYLLKDRRRGGPRTSAPAHATLRSLADDCIYLADDLGQASAFTWVNVELATALAALGAPVFISGGERLGDCAARRAQTARPPGARRRADRRRRRSSSRTTGRAISISS